MEMQLTNRSFTNFVRLLSLLIQIHKWERELRRATRMINSTMVDYATRRLDALYLENEKLCRKIEKAG